MDNFPKLPFDVNFFTPAILKSTIKANKVLAELKGYLGSIEESDIIVYLLSLKEAKESNCLDHQKEMSYDDIFKSIISSSSISKEVEEIIRYQNILLDKFHHTKSTKDISINEILEASNELIISFNGIRKSESFKISSEYLNFAPPQSRNQVIELIKNLFTYLKVDEELDDVIKIALAKYQIEYIAPYYQHNLKLSSFFFQILLASKDLMNYPVLPFSSYIVKHQKEYFELFQKAIMNDDSLKKLLIFLINGIAQVAEETLVFAIELKKRITSTAISMQKYLPKVYSEKLVSLLFRSIYLKNEILQKELNITRNTATKYFQLLEEFNFLEKEKSGKEQIYKNTKLINLLEK